MGVVIGSLGARADGAVALFQEIFPEMPPGGFAQFEDQAQLTPDQMTRLADEKLRWLQVMADLNRASPARAEEIVAHLSGPPGACAVEALFLERASNDRAAALTWLATLPAEVSAAAPSEKLAYTFRSLASDAPVLWQRWLDALPAGPLRTHAALAALPQIAEAGRWEEAVESYRRGFAIDAEGRAGAELARTLAEHDGPRAAAWVQTLPAGAAQTRAAEGWSADDPAAGAQWVERLPPGALRDGAIAGYAQAVATVDPPSAAASLERIEDPATRRRAAGGVFRMWQVENPVLARSWLRDLAGLDAAWQERTLQSER